MRYPHSLRTAEKAAALEKAKLLIDAAEQHKLAAMRGLLSGQPARPESCRLAGLLQPFERLPDQIPVHFAKGST